MKISELLYNQAHAVDIELQKAARDDSTMMSTLSSMSIRRRTLLDASDLAKKHEDDEQAAKASVYVHDRRADAREKGIAASDYEQWKSAVNLLTKMGFVWLPGPVTTGNWSHGPKGRWVAPE